MKSPVAAKMFDGRYYQDLKRPNTLQIIPTLGNKIILAKEEQPTKSMDFTLLGGRQEPNEDPIRGAKRELLEESGLSSENWENYGVFSPIHKMEWDIYYFVARDCQKIAQQKLDGGEKIELIEVNFNDFIDIVLSENFWGSDLVLRVAKLKLDNKLMILKILFLNKKLRSGF